VAAEREPGDDLVLHYFLDGEVGRTRPSLQDPATRRRADGLWRHTCLEAFVKPVEGPAGGEAYWEFNLAPSLDWQAYAFEGYRRDQQQAQIAAPMIESRYGASGWELSVRWRLGGVVPGGAWRLAVSAVIEEPDGALSYWALRHPAGRPDFHHRDGFILNLAVTA